MIIYFKSPVQNNWPLLSSNYLKEKLGSCVYRSEKITINGIVLEALIIASPFSADTEAIVEIIINDFKGTGATSERYLAVKRYRTRVFI